MSNNDVCSIATDDRTFSVEEAVMYVVEINEAMAEATGLDLTSAAIAGIDAAGAVQLTRTIGLRGRGYIKTHNGKQYLILKGRAGARPVLTGTRYLATNPKVAKLVVTSRTLAKSAARATGLAVIAFAGLRVVEHLLADNDPRLTRLFGTIASDVAKFAVAAAAGYLAGAAVGAMTTVLAGPLIAAVVVGIGVSILLDRADRKFGLTESLVRSIESAVDGFQNPFKVIAREINRWERSLIDRAIGNSMRRW